MQQRKDWRSPLITNCGSYIASLKLVIKYMSINSMAYISVHALAGQLEFGSLSAHGWLTLKVA